VDNIYAIVLLWISVMTGLITLYIGFNRPRSERTTQELLKLSLIVFTSSGIALAVMVGAFISSYQLMALVAESLEVRQTGTGILTMAIALTVAVVANRYGATRALRT